MLKLFSSSLLAGFLVASLSAPVFADDESAAVTAESSSQGDDAAPGSSDGAEQSDQISLSLIRVSIRDQVVAAMEESGQSFVLSRDLEGWSSLFLYAVSYEEALDLMLMPHCARWSNDDGIIHVMSQVEWTDRGGQEDERPIETQGEADAADTHTPPTVEDGEVNLEETEFASSFDIRLTDLDILLALQLLSLQAEQNMVVSNEVSGAVTCVLLDVSFDTALDEIIAIHDLKRVDLDNAVWIMTQDEWKSYLAQTEGDSAGGRGEASPRVTP